MNYPSNRNFFNERNYEASSRKTININYDKKNSGTNLLEYHIFYKHRIVCSGSNKINGKTAGNYQRILIRATSANRKMRGESKQYTVNTELLTFIVTLPHQSRPDNSAQCGDRHALRRFDK
jgi:hypothetical protein